MDAPAPVRTRAETRDEKRIRALDAPVASTEASTPQYEPSIQEIAIARVIGRTDHQEL